MSNNYSVFYSGTCAGQMLCLQPELTPLSINPMMASEQQFPVDGLLTTDTVVVNCTGNVADVCVTSSRVPVDGRIAITFMNYGSRAATPYVGPYRILVFRELTT